MFTTTESSIEEKIPKVRIYDQFSSANLMSEHLRIMTDMPKASTVSQWADLLVRFELWLVNMYQYLPEDSNFSQEFEQHCNWLMRVIRGSLEVAIAKEYSNYKIEKLKA